MRHKRLKLNAVLLLGLGLTTVLQAQESVNATGGNASGSEGSASYSVGQVVYTTNTGTNGSVAQGVQQPFEISVVTGIEETTISLFIFVYPNPTTDYLTLKVDKFELLTLSFQLFDMNGKLLQNKKVTDNETSINMSNLVPATYFVKVIEGNKELKTFKIIRN